LLAFQAIFKKEHLRIGRSLLKNSIAELYEEEKHRNSPLYETYSQHFSSKNMVFRILKNSSFDFFNRLVGFLRCIDVLITISCLPVAGEYLLCSSAAGR